MFPEYGFLDLIAHCCLYRKKTLPHLMLGLRYDRHRMIHRQSEKKRTVGELSYQREWKVYHLEGVSNRRAFHRTGFASKFDKMFIIITMKGLDTVKSLSAGARGSIFLLL